MDLSAAIRLKIDVLRGSKISRFNALSSAIERDVAMLTQQSAELFSRLEDALEADVLGKSDRDDAEYANKQSGGETEKEDAVEEDAIADDSHEQPVDNQYEDYAVHYGEENENYGYDLPHQENRQSGPSPILPPVTVKKQEDPAPSTINLPLTTSDPKSPGSLVSYLRSRAQETQKQLAEKNISLTTLRTKHEAAMKRLDKLQSDLEKVSQKWEEEERTRIQSESTTVLGKRKREEDEQGTSWKTVGRKGVEWGVLFGFGIASAIGISKFQTR